ncbi:hypothetical protein [Nocardia brevicatena]|uniref:hypothetical protein n=1 Tax=Nocardia brevicatena TaxID=37327 RepID=UPI001C3F2A9C|nr:hypothetical protein [Nocardia brevicatena]
MTSERSAQASAFGWKLAHPATFGHAALVAAGRAETLNAWGGQVKPLSAMAPAGEAGTHRGAT